MDRTLPKLVCHCFAQEFIAGGVSDHDSSPRTTTRCGTVLTRRQRRLPHLLFCANLVFLICVFAISSTEADVIVLANRTPAAMPLRFVPASGAARQLTLAPGETMPLYLDGKAALTFAASGAQKHYSLDANCAYFFGRSQDGRVDLQKIGLGGDGTAAEGRKLPGNASRASSVTIPVKILVDEEEPGRTGIWQQRLKRRVEAASAIF